MFLRPLWRCRPVVHNKNADPKLMTARRSIRLRSMSLGMLCRSLLLPLLLLLAQQGAVLHGLSHYSATSAPDQRGEPERQQPHSGPCELCLAFAHLDAAVKPAPLAIVLPVLGFEALAVSRVLAWEAPAPPEQSRGPPTHL